MNNNKLDERAILAGCKGVFSPTSYISIGTKGKAEEYDKKLKDHPRYGGKRIGTAWPKEGKTNDAYFQKEHKWVFSGCKFNDRLKYATEQQEKKKGFLTSDFSRRDEFSLDFRTEQYREQLGMENKYAKKALELLESSDETSGGPSTTVALGPAEGIDKPFLFDLVYEKEDPTQSKASKTSRDTRNPTKFSHERDFGNMRTTMRVAHAAPDVSCFGKPQFANKPLIRDTFYRKTNVFFPDNCAAVDKGDT